MEGVNKTMLMGTVGSDPEVKNINGTTLTKFSLATNRTFVSKKTGEKTTETQWHNIEAWGPIGESMAKYVKKGKNLFIEGEIKYSTYEKDGVKMRSTVITALEFKFAGNSQSNGEAKTAVTEEGAKESVKQYAASASAPSASSEPTRTVSSAEVVSAPDDEDELPF